jgi:hypothetical protein
MILTGLDAGSSLSQIVCRQPERVLVTTAYDGLILFFKSSFALLATPDFAPL